MSKQKKYTEVVEQPLEEQTTVSPQVESNETETPEVVEETQSVEKVEEDNQLEEAVEEEKVEEPVLESPQEDSKITLHFKRSVEVYINGTPYVGKEVEVPDYMVAGEVIRNAKAAYGNDILG